MIKELSSKEEFRRYVKSIDLINRTTRYISKNLDVESKIISDKMIEFDSYDLFLHHSRRSTFLEINNLLADFIKIIDSNAIIVKDISYNHNVLNLIVRSNNKSFIFYISYYEEPFYEYIENYKVISINPIEFSDIFRLVEVKKRICELFETQYKIYGNSLNSNYKNNINELEYLEYCSDSKKLKSVLFNNLIKEELAQTNEIKSRSYRHILISDKLSLINKNISKTYSNISNIISVLKEV